MHGAKADILETIGDTPIVRLNKLGADLPCNLHVKLEYFNPGLSIKDRIGHVMIDEAQRRGDIQVGGTIIESTSGNTGVGLALAAIIRGYKVIFVMPDKVSVEKVRNLRAFGAQVISCPTAVAPDDPRSYYSVARRLSEETPNSIYVNQYDNLDNPLAHYRQTGPEIWEQTGGEVDTIVLGLGTGGTVSGVGRYLKERKPSIKMVGVDPIGSIYHDFFKTGEIGEAHTYLIEGIGEDIIPAASQNLEFVDEMIRVTDGEAFDVTRRLVRDEAIFVGISSGAAVAGALAYGANARQGENVVVILPDSGIKYLSKAFNDDWLREHGLLEPRLEATASVLVGSGSDRILTATRQSTVSQVVESMQQGGFSSVPIVDDGQVVGVVGESELLTQLVAGGVGSDDPVEKVMSSRFVITEVDAPLPVVLQGVNDFGIAIVVDGRELKGVVTRIDLVSYFTKQL